MVYNITIIKKKGMVLTIGRMTKAEREEHINNIIKYLEVSREEAIAIAKEDSRIESMTMKEIREEMGTGEFDERVIYTTDISWIPNRHKLGKKRFKIWCG